jgi:hypothetical protein
VGACGIWGFEIGLRLSRAKPYSLARWGAAVLRPCNFRSAIVARCAGLKPGAHIRAAPRLGICDCTREMAGS